MHQSTFSSAQLLAVAVVVVCPIPAFNTLTDSPPLSQQLNWQPPSLLPLPLPLPLLCPPCHLSSHPPCNECSRSARWMQTLISGFYEAQVDFKHATLKYCASMTESYVKSGLSITWQGFALVSLTFSLILQLFISV